MYRVVTGSVEQLNELPWNRIDRVAVQFDRDVNVTQADLVLTGVNVAQYTVTGFTYDAATDIATWTLSGAVDTDKFLVNLNASAITSAGAGLALDGEFTTSVTNLLTTGSGDGMPGGDFRFRFNVVVGDVDRNGRTLTADRSPILLNLNATAGTSANYSVFADVDGNGRIQTADLSPISLNLNDRLPTAEPLAHTFGTGGASTLSASTSDSTSTALLVRSGAARFSTAPVTSVYELIQERDDSIGAG